MKARFEAKVLSFITLTIIILGGIFVLLEIFQSKQCLDRLGCISLPPAAPIKIVVEVITIGKNAEISQVIFNSITNELAAHPASSAGHPLIAEAYFANCTISDRTKDAAMILTDKSVVAVIGPACVNTDQTYLKMLSDGGLTVISIWPTEITPSLEGIFSLFPSFSAQADLIISFIRKLNEKTNRFIVYDKIGSSPSPLARQILAQANKSNISSIIVNKDISNGSFVSRPDDFNIIVMDDFQTEDEYLLGLDPKLTLFFNPDLIYPSVLGTTHKGWYLLPPWNQKISPQQYNAYAQSASENTISLLIPSILAVSSSNPMGFLSIPRNALREKISITGSLNSSLPFFPCNSPQSCMVADELFVPVWNGEKTQP